MEKKEIFDRIKMGFQNFLKTDRGEAYKKNMSESRKGKNNPIFNNNGEGLAKLKIASKKRWDSLTEEQKQEQIKIFMKAPLYTGLPNKPETVIINMNIPNVKYTGDGSLFIPMTINGKNRRKNPDFLVGEGTNKKFIEVMDKCFWHKEDWLSIEKGYEESGEKLLILDAEQVIKNPVETRGLIESFANNHYAKIIKIKNFNYKSQPTFVYNLEVENQHNYFAIADMGETSNRQYKSKANPIPLLVSNCHASTKDFQNAMLKILEEPPRGVYFILCTTEPEKLLKTIKTRATTYTVSPLRKHDMVALIDWVLKSENIVLTDKVKGAVMFAAEGCARKALVILDQIIDIPEEEKQLEAIAENTPEEVLVIELCRKIIARESGAERWKGLSTMLKGIDQEAESIRRAILGYLTTVLLSSKGDEAKKVALLISEFSNNYYDSGKAGLITSCFMSTLVS
jgi:DNA polymerase III delta prime subunit